MERTAYLRSIRHLCVCEMEFLAQPDSNVVSGREARGFARLIETVVIRRATRVVDGVVRAYAVAREVLGII